MRRARDRGLGGRLRPGPARRRPALAGAGLLLALVVGLGACAAAGAERDTVVVGAGSHPEQEVLGAIVATALQRGGYEVAIRGDLGDTVGLRREAASESIDVFVDYTGAAWGLGLGEQAPPADREESWERVREADLANGLRWLAPSRADATLALAVRAEATPSEGEATMSWLAGELSGGQRSLCAEVDFLLREGGLDAIAREYGIDLARLPRRPATTAEAVEEVAAQRCFAGLVTATSGAARAADLVVVTDDLDVWPAFVVAPVVREGSPADEPGVAEALEPAMAALDTATLATLNAEHAAGQDPDDLATRFLDEAVGEGA